MYTYIIIIFLLLLLLIMKRWFKKEHQGFTQDGMFSLKTNDDIYDDFYVSVYDNIFQPTKYLNEEYAQMMDKLSLKDNADVLDIGSKTGHFLKLLDRKYNAHGLEQSTQMIEYTKEKYDDLTIHHGDMLNNQIFDKNIFDCIFLRDFMIYTVYDKPQLLGNCYYWLKPSGYLVIHLVNKKKYNPLVEVANYNTNPQDYVDERITKCNVISDDIHYNQETDFMADNRVIVKESFTDMSTYQTRQNERTLYMEDKKAIEQTILRCGFSAQALYALNKDKEQFVYIFKKINF